MSRKHSYKRYYSVVDQDEYEASRKRSGSFDQHSENEDNYAFDVFDDLTANIQHKHKKRRRRSQGDINDPACEQLMLTTDLSEPANDVIRDSKKVNFDNALLHTINIVIYFKRPVLMTYTTSTVHQLNHCLYHSSYSAYFIVNLCVSQYKYQTLKLLRLRRLGFTFISLLQTITFVIYVKRPELMTYITHKCVSCIR